MRNETNSVTIHFYDATGKLQDTRIVEGPLRNDSSIDGIMPLTYVVSADFMSHCPYRGGRMEIFSAEIENA